MNELMFQAGVKGMSERSELIPCIVYTHMHMHTHTHSLLSHVLFPAEVLELIILGEKYVK